MTGQGLYCCFRVAFEPLYHFPKAQTKPPHQLQLNNKPLLYKMLCFYSFFVIFVKNCSENKIQKGEIYAIGKRNNQRKTEEDDI